MSICEFDKIFLMGVIVYGILWKGKVFNIKRSGRIRTKKQFHSSLERFTVFGWPDLWFGSTKQAPSVVAAKGSCMKKLAFGAWTWRFNCCSCSSCGMRFCGLHFHEWECGVQIVPCTIKWTPSFPLHLWSASLDHMWCPPFTCSCGIQDDGDLWRHHPITTHVAEVVDDGRISSTWHT